MIDLDTTPAACEQFCLEDKDCLYAAFDTDPSQRKCFRFYTENLNIIDGGTFVLFTKVFETIPGEFPVL